MTMTIPENTDAPDFGAEVAAEQVDYPRILYVCEHCQENAPEMCGRSRDDLYVTPSGQWLCDECIDEEGVPISDCVPPPALYPASTVARLQQEIQRLKAAELSEVRQQYVDANEARIDAEALSRTGAVKVKVKPLEWSEYETDGWADRADAEAGSFGVFYNIDIQPDGYRVVFDHEAVGVIGTFDTADAAKAAAQADYERRILSTLTTEPAAREGEPRPMTGFFSNLSPEGQAAALAYDGPEPNIEDTAPEGRQEAVAYGEEIGGKIVAVSLHKGRHYTVPLYTRPNEQAVTEADLDDVEKLFLAARVEADKAMRKFPQPNYVISKIAEEAGEVVKAAIHCAEGRETSENVVAEIRQAMAMLIRLYIEGDQVHGLPPLKAAMEAGQ